MPLLQLFQILMQLPIPHAVMRPARDPVDGSREGPVDRIGIADLSNMVIAPREIIPPNLLLKKNPLYFNGLLPGKGKNYTFASAN